MMKRILIPLLCGCTVLGLAAQAKDLKTEITVDRTVIPVEREAVRLGSLTPQLLSSSVTPRSLTLADYTETSELTRTNPVLSPAAYADRLALSPYRGYAAVGYFPAFNLGASAGYKFISSEHTSLGAWLQYDGYSYKPSDKSGGSYSNNTVTVGADFGRRFGATSLLKASARFMYGATGRPDVFAEDKQNVTAADLGVSWRSVAGVIDYNIGAGFDHFGYGKDGYINEFEKTPLIKPASENRFSFCGGVGYLGSSETPRGGIDLSVDFISRSNGVEMGQNQLTADLILPYVEPVRDGTLGVISLTPYYSYRSDNFSARIGAKFDISAGGEDKKFHVAPDVMLDLNAAPQFAIYATFRGGEHLNSLSSLYNYCPFMSGIWQHQRSNIPLDCNVGMNIGPFAGFSARIFGGYAVADNWLMPQFIRMTANGEPLIDSYQEMYSIINFGRYDLKSWHAGIGLSYEWRSAVKVHATAEIASNDKDKAYYRWRDRAKYVVTSGIEVRPINKLKIGVSHELRAGRRNFADSYGDRYAINLRNVSNLNAEASYDISDALTVFACGENLLNRRYELVTGIDAQGLKGLVGVSYKF